MSEGHTRSERGALLLRNAEIESRFEADNLFVKPMVLLSDGSSAHVAHELRTIGLFGDKINPISDYSSSN